MVSNLAHRAEDVETPRLSSQRQSRGEGECLAQADGERPRAVVAKGDIAEAGEFEFGIRPTPGLGETALRFQGGKACGLEVAVVGESGLDQRFDAERGRLECRKGQQQENGKNFKRHGNRGRRMTRRRAVELQNGAARRERRTGRVRISSAAYRFPAEWMTVALSDPLARTGRGAGGEKENGPAKWLGCVHGVSSCDGGESGKYHPIRGGRRRGSARKGSGNHAKRRFPNAQRGARGKRGSVRGLRLERGT